jgi:hypothetical protein
MYEGKEKCQGCNKPGTEASRESKDSLCHSCFNYLELGKSKEIEIQNNYTYIAQFYHALVNIEFADGTLNTGLHEVLKSLDNPSAKTNDTIIGLIGRYYDNSFRVKIPSDLVEPIKNLFMKLDDIALKLRQDLESLPRLAAEEVYKEKDRIYNEGVSKGRDLLFQLNSGDLSLSDFEKTVHYKSNK